MKYMVRIISTHQGATPFDGKLLSRYDPQTPGLDPNGESMVATLEVTDDPMQALHFDSAAEALALYRMEAPPNPRARRHGKPGPNRPLTAFSVEIERVP